MKTWIITGGIACGKSSFSALLVKHLTSSVADFSADRESQLWLDDELILKTLEKEFGQHTILIEGGQRRANRPKLREIIFGDPKARIKLEEILHPHVLNGLENAREKAHQSGTELFLAEVPLHYEIGSTVTADLIIVVAASHTVQVRRLMERRGLEQSVIEQMLRSQWPIEAKVERADVVIWNDGDSEALEAQVLTLAREHWHDESNRNP